MSRRPFRLVYRQVVNSRQCAVSCGSGGVSIVSGIYTCGCTETCTSLRLGFTKACDHPGIELSYDFLSLIHIARTCREWICCEQTVRPEVLSLQTAFNLHSIFIALHFQCHKNIYLSLEFMNRTGNGKRLEFRELNVLQFRTEEGCQGTQI